jgi:leader peptidase (prepilin peptidase)/N-methyltransferase
MPFIVPLCSVVIGLVIGSFLNVVIFRFNRQSMSVFKPARSVCLHCNGEIKWYDNIPLLSFLLLKGKCRYCHHTLSWRYPFVEALTAGCFLLNSYVFSSLLALLGADILIAALIVLFFTDLDTMLISDYTTLFVLIGCALIYIDQGEYIINLITAGIAFALIYLLKVLFKILAKKDALGMVDIVLISALALILGPMKINLAVFISCLAGIIAAILFRKKMQDKIPFGPFIAIGGYVSLIFGDFFLKSIGFYPYF